MAKSNKGGFPARPTQTWVCMCGRTFRIARKCLRCGDDLPWLVYGGEISYAQRRLMSTNQYKAWREQRESEEELSKKLIEARTSISGWLNARK